MAVMTHAKFGPTSSIEIFEFSAEGGPGGSCRCNENQGLINLLSIGHSRLGLLPGNPGKAKLPGEYHIWQALY